MKITVPEMRGLLKGLCLPADIRTGEYLPEYLVRKFDELQQKLDAMAAENAALKKILTPSEIPEEAITAFENTVEFDHDFKEGNSWTWVDNETEVIRAVLAAMSLPETPATDAYLNSVRAEGVEILTTRLQQLIDEGVFDAKEIGVAAGAVYEGAQIAANLRSGTHDTADKAD
ncbi:hypothetical protein [Pantoea ananatis]|uniref:hypothetical protein n=1 Tax=Pantoea ananas TaxID=553 RepID=UPI0005349FA0|nr:hypothetical protein [Pantoea ananatis]